MDDTVPDMISAAIAVRISPKWLSIVFTVFHFILQYFETHSGDGDIRMLLNENYIGFVYSTVCNPFVTWL